MAEAVKIGDKVEIRIQKEVEKAKELGETPRVFVSQVLDIMEDGDFELAMPFEGTKIILLPLDLRYEFVFIGKKGMYRAYGMIKERYKMDNRFMILVQCSNSLEKYQRRAYYRLECMLDVTYWVISEEQAKMPRMEDVKRSLVLESDYRRRSVACNTLDISGGGTKLLTDRFIEKNQYLYLVFQIGEEDQVAVVGRVLSCEERDIPKGHYNTRVEFFIKDQKITEQIVRYIFTEERKNRRIGKGIIK